MSVSVTPDIFVTTVYFLLTLFLVDVIRQFLRFFFHRAFPLLERCAQEFIAAFELCAICYEINILLEYPSVIIYGLYLFLASVWWGLRWEDTTSAPYSYIVDFIFEDTTFVTLVLVVASQLSGGFLFYQYYIRPLWSLGYGDLHNQKFEDNSICISDIQAPVFVSSIVEGAGVCASILTAKIASAKFNSIVGTTIESFVSTVLVILALNISGGYYNPVLASATQYGCFGSTPAEHFVVYWVGETIGAIVAYLLWERALRHWLEDERPKED